MIIPAIQNRRSVRQFQSKPVLNELILEIIKAAQFAPEAMHKLGLEFVVITNPDIKEKIHQILAQDLDQDYVAKAPVLILPIADTTKAVLTTQDLSVATQNIFLQATEAGLGSVWKNINPKFIPEIRNILNITDNYTFINIIPIGYPQETPQAHTDSDFFLDKIRYIK